MTTLDPLVAALTARRKRRGMSSAHLADFAAMSRAYVHRVEAGQCSPTLRTLRRLADVLGCDLELVARTEGNQP